MARRTEGVHAPLILNHLAKAGGSFARDILLAAVPGPDLRIQEEPEEVSAQDVQGNFIIGLIRNPYNYYVSLWAFSSTPGTCCFHKALTTLQRKTLLGQDRPLGASDTDKARFRDWLYATSSKELGVLSLRFYGSYLRQGSPGIPRTWHYMSAQAPEVCDHAAVATQALANFSLDSGPVSCWAHTEQLVPDLRACLERYEAQAGGVSLVDWTAFNRSAVSLSHNDVDHAACSGMYDAEAMAFVADSDRHIFRAFGYPGKCS